MKGQYLIVEYIIFFIIGIVIVITVYFVFSGMSSSLGESFVKAQLRKTGEMIRGTIVNVFEKAKETNSTVSYILEIPTKLSGCIYMIRADGLEQPSLSLNCTRDPRVGVLLTLYNYNISEKNIIYSTKGSIQIKYDNILEEIKIS